MTPRDSDALKRIVECLDAIDAYVERGGWAWPDDGMVIDAVAKRIEEIGEVAKRVSVETLAQMPEINWRGLKGIREVLAHDYDEIDVDVIVDVVHDRLPEVRAAIVRTLEVPQHLDTQIDT